MTGATRFGGLREVLAARQPMSVAMITIPDPAIAHILARSGFDLLILDAEHGPFDLQEIRSCLDATSQFSTFVTVRVRGLEPNLVKQVLDLGPDGVVMPDVRTSDDATAFVASCRYPPEGRRGIGGGRAQGYGLDEGYRDRANSVVAAIAIIESREGVRNARSIVATSGLDGVLIGTTDLRADLASDDASARDAIIDVVACATEKGVPVGLPALDPDVSLAGLPPIQLHIAFADHWNLAQAAKSALQSFRDFELRSGGAA